MNRRRSLADGQLPGATADGWQARASDNGVTISAPGRQPLVVSEGEEMRAFGFSPDGTTFIIATSPGLAIYHRGTNGNDPALPRKGTASGTPPPAPT